MMAVAAPPIQWQAMQKLNVAQADAPCLLQGNECKSFPLLKKIWGK